MQDAAKSHTIFANHSDSEEHWKTNKRAWTTRREVIGFGIYSAYPKVRNHGGGHVIRNVCGFEQGQFP
nr:unnamed protein product [Fasciola hepatica]